jgi:hypothetical protein
LENRGRGEILLSTVQEFRSVHAFERLGDGDIDWLLRRPAKGDKGGRDTCKGAEELFIRRAF